MQISGKFNVALNRLDNYAEGADGMALGRMSIDKEFFGELAAISKGEMLSALTPTKGSAGYVAIEQVTGSLCGKSGSFVLQHFGLMDRGYDQLILEVVPDSATGELEGLKGCMKICIEEGEQHFYDFDFHLPGLTNLSEQDEAEAAQEAKA